MDGQHPIAFNEMFPSLGDDSQQKEKYDDLAPRRLLFSEFSDSVCNIFTALSQHEIHVS
jgi:hypothetical protein